MESILFYVTLDSGIINYIIHKKIKGKVWNKLIGIVLCKDVQ